MASINGWDIFNTTAATTTNTILYTTNTWDNTSLTPYVSIHDPLLDEAAPRPKDPLAWLHDRVAEVCDLGRLQ